MGLPPPATSGLCRGRPKASQASPQLTRPSLLATVAVACASQRTPAGSGKRCSPPCWWWEPQRPWAHHVRLGSEHPPQTRSGRVQVACRPLAEAAVQLGALRARGQLQRRRCSPRAHVALLTSSTSALACPALVQLLVASATRVGAGHGLPCQTSPSLREPCIATPSAPFKGVSSACCGRVQRHPRFLDAPFELQEVAPHCQARLQSSCGRIARFGAVQAVGVTGLAPASLCAASRGTTSRARRLLARLRWSTDQTTTP